MSNLVKLVAVAIVLFLAWQGYQHFSGGGASGAAFEVYKQYADAMAREDYEKAKTFATGLAITITDLEIQKANRPALKVFGRTATLPKKSEIIGDVAWIKWEKKSEESPGNDIHFEVIETVCRIPPGVASAICKWPVDFQHNVTMTLQGDTWKVSSFRETKI